MAKSQSFYLDTSFIIKLLNYDEIVERKLLAKHANGSRYAAYLSIIEFNTGFFGAILKFRRLIQEYDDVSFAMIKMGNSFDRGSNHGLLFLGIFTKYVSLLGTDDPQLFIDQMDEVAIEIHNRATRMIRNFIGNYKDHKSAITQIQSSADFDRIPKPRTKDSRPNLSDFWTNYLKNIEEFQKVLDPSIATTKKDKSDIQDLIDLVELILSDPTSNVKHKHKNDFAICLQAPNSCSVVAYDHIFHWMIPYLNKKGAYIQLPDNPQGV